MLNNNLLGAGELVRRSVGNQLVRGVADPPAQTAVRAWDGVRHRLNALRLQTTVDHEDAIATWILEIREGTPLTVSRWLVHADRFVGNELRELPSPHFIISPGEFLTPGGTYFVREQPWPPAR